MGAAAAEDEANDGGAAGAAGLALAGVDAVGVLERTGDAVGVAVVAEGGAFAPIARQRPPEAQRQAKMPFTAVGPGVALANEGQSEEGADRFFCCGRCSP